jgi:hypothetical protein
MPVQAVAQRDADAVARTVRALVLLDVVDDVLRGEIPDPAGGQVVAGAGPGGGQVVPATAAASCYWTTQSFGAQAK